MTNSSLNSTANRLVPKHPPRRRRLLAAVFLATGAALVLLPARRARAFLFDIVLDPVNAGRECPAGGGPWRAN